MDETSSNCLLVNCYQPARTLAAPGQTSAWPAKPLLTMLSTEEMGEESLIRAGGLRLLEGSELPVRGQDLTELPEASKLGPGMKKPLKSHTQV